MAKLCTWFASFFENALVSLVTRRCDMRIVKVLPLRLALADQVQVRRALHDDPLHPVALAGAVPPVRGGGLVALALRVAVVLYQHGIVHGPAERLFHRLHVHLAPSDVSCTQFRRRAAAPARHHGLEVTVEKVSPGIPG